MKKDSKKNPPKKAPALRQSATASTTQAETTTTPTITTTTASNVETPSSQPQPLFTRHELNQIRQRERIIAERKRREENAKTSEQTLNQSSTALRTPVQTTTSVTSSTSTKMSPIKSQSKPTLTSQSYATPAKFQLDTPSQTATFQTPSQNARRTSRTSTPSRTPIRETSVATEMRAIQQSIAEEKFMSETSDKNPIITTTTETMATETLSATPSDSQTQEKIQITMQIDPKAATFRKVQAPLQPMSQSLQQTAETTGQATVLIAIRRCPKCSKVTCECTQEPSTSNVSMEAESTKPSLVALATGDISQIVEEQETRSGRSLQDYRQQFGITTNESVEPQRLIIDESMNAENTQASLSPRVPLDPMQDELNRSRSTLSTPASQYMSIEEPVQTISRMPLAPEPSSESQARYDPLLDQEHEVLLQTEAIQHTQIAGREYIEYQGTTYDVQAIRQNMREGRFIEPGLRQLIERIDAPPIISQSYVYLEQLAPPSSYCSMLSPPTQPLQLAMMPTTTQFSQMPPPMLPMTHYVPVQQPLLQSVPPSATMINPTPLEFSQSRDFQQFQVLPGPNDATSVEDETISRAGTSLRPSVSQDVITPAQLRTALAEVTQSQSKYFEQWAQLSQERQTQLETQLRLEREQHQREMDAQRILAQEQIRQQQEMMKDLINTMKNQFSQSIPLKPASPPRQFLKPTKTNVFERTERSRTRDSFRSTVASRIESDPRRSAKRTSTQQLAEQPPAAVQRFDSSVMSPPKDLSKSMPVTASTSRQSIQAPSPSNIPMPKLQSQIVVPPTTKFTATKQQVESQSRQQVESQQTTFARQVDDVIQLDSDHESDQEEPKQRSRSPTVTVRLPEVRKSVGNRLSRPMLKCQAYIYTPKEGEFVRMEPQDYLHGTDSFNRLETPRASQEYFIMIASATIAIGIAVLTDEDRRDLQASPARDWPLLLQFGSSTIDAPNPICVPPL